MKKLDYIKALETIKNALCEVLGALKADYFKESAKPCGTSQDNVIEIQS